MYMAGVKICGTCGQERGPETIRDPYVCPLVYWRTMTDESQTQETETGSRSGDCQAGRGAIEWPQAERRIVSGTWMFCAIALQLFCIIIGVFDSPLDSKIAYTLFSVVPLLYR